MGTKRLDDIQEQSHTLAENGTYWEHAFMSLCHVCDYRVFITFLSFIERSSMQHWWHWRNSPGIKNRCFPYMHITTPAIHRRRRNSQNSLDFFHTYCHDLHNSGYLHVHLGMMHVQIISHESLFPTLHSFKMVMRNNMLWHFCGNFEHSKLRNSLGIFCICGNISKQTKAYRITECLGHLYITSIWMFKIPTSWLDGN